MTKPASKPRRQRNSPPSPGHKRHPRRRLLIVGIILALPILLFLLVTRSALTSWIVTPVLENLTGASIKMDNATVGLDGSVTLLGVRSDAPGVDGPAATFLRVQKVEAKFRWRELLTGGGVRTITLHEPKLLLSQSTESQTLNVSALTLLRPSGGTSGPLPTVVIDDASLEIGEHTGSSYSPLSAVHFDASVIPDPASPSHASTIRITPLAPEGPIIGIPGQFITGRIDADGVTLTPGDVSLASLRPATLPATVRKELELLDLSGRLRVRTFTYSFATGKVEAEVRLNGIAMNLPVTPTTGDGGQGPLRMQGVSGTIALRADRIRADLRGTLGDMPWTVRLAYEGPSAEAAFTCELETDGFHVSKRPDLLPFAPPIVKERLDGFSQPTATVSSRVRITRDPPTPTGPSPIHVDGTLEFKDGVAAFIDFPYRFENLSGSVRFDENTLELLRIEGEAPSGARLVATGLISPINELAQVDVKVRAVNVPVDETLEDALGPERREVVDALFNRDRLAELVRAGLVLDPAEAARLREDEARLVGVPNRSPEAENRLAAVRQALAERPSFDPGGRATVDVHVTREEGYLTPWQTDVIVHFDRLHVLPEAFPLPIVGSDVTLHITDQLAVLEGGMYQTLRGGLAMVDCSVELFAPDGSQAFIPVVDINAADIPIDDLLIHALPDRPVSTEGQNADRPSVQDALRALNLAGGIDIQARIAPLENPTPATDDSSVIQLGYQVHADAGELSAMPAPTAGSDSRLVLTKLRGTLDVSERGLSARVRSNIETSLLSNPATVSEAGQATLAFTADFTSLGAPSSVDATITSLNTAAPIEDAVRPLASGSAERIAALRARHVPSGRLDAVIDLSLRGSNVTGEIVLSRPEHLAFDALGGRMSLSVPEGSIALVLGSEGNAQPKPDSATLVRFDGLAAAVDFDEEPIGRIDASGTLAISADATGLDPARTDLRVIWADAPLSTRAIGDLVRQRLGDTMGDLYALHTPSGRFDMELALRANPASPSTLGAWGSVRPRFLSLTRFGQPLDFPSTGGVVHFSPDGGTIDALTLNAEGTSLHIDGAWTAPAGASPKIDLNVSGWTTAQGQTLRAMLPEQLHNMAENADLSVEGGVRLDRLRLSVDGDPKQEGAIVRASGAATVDRASMRVGPPITDLSGVIQFTARTSPGSTTFDVGMIANSLRVSNLLVTDARLRVTSDPNDPTVIAPLISGSAHGGRFSGRATIGPDPVNGQRRRYFASIHVAGARFASVLADLTRRAGVDTVADPDASRGLLDAELTIEGIVGEEASQVGRGEMAISGGEVLSFPLLLPILQVANLQVPSRERLDLALSTFHLSEGRVTFEDMSVFSPSVELFGYGTMSWPATDLDLRVVSRGARQLPIVSSVVEAIRNELISISVGGTLADPDVSLQQFTSARGLLKRLLEGSSSERAREMERIRLRAYASQDRVRRAGERIKELSQSAAMEGEN